jgi:hypothetical protein
MYKVWLVAFNNRKLKHVGARRVVFFFYTLVDTMTYSKNAGQTDIVGCSPWHRNGTGGLLPMAVQYHSSSRFLEFYSIMVLVNKSL